MDIDWFGFLEVFVVSFAAAVGVMVLFAIAVALLSPSEPAAHKASATTGASGTTSATSVSGFSALIAILCFLACAAVIVYGLYIIVS